ncbi:hypothetical protein MLD38_020587 [Melastoma candidum]|uniref:Uncharacterized protein n=1 Tax=Melastoma candidum TaxID=119954 RepID=A0ACB9QDX1_9MYRT|nr:hypothetical protein MLD38_020587 [Melastoma candidum]
MAEDQFQSSLLEAEALIPSFQDEAEDECHAGAGRDYPRMGEDDCLATSRWQFLQLEQLQGRCNPSPSEYIDAGIDEPNLVFYWGLKPGHSNPLDVQSLKDDFWTNFKGYPDPVYGENEQRVRLLCQHHPKNMVGFLAVEQGAQYFSGLR